ncbi:peptide-methionine (S)-S-oxide reductase MsrA [Croceivirga thetidis]|uniref:Peptide methionine sulfoxide reductase MsrA n=1 Tax=Croceivirga thetidis TaxID=2721623 RepID=A0ABX1GV28_9FLAO|nr:peptide-methionine (S)-S-oxide reductase MsrA [Croceivirga thetidis]NKI32886.1 peptide-methionine (S)-S-oxide reductase MsrA [Croceivirga thetidis]
MKKVILLVALIFATSCQTNTKAQNEKAIAHQIPEKEVFSNEQLQDFETAYFASGCFWCVEAIFESVKGVKEVVSGYSGGKEANPTYEDVGYGRTTHAEAVEVYYDPQQISFLALVQVFFGSHDPTSLNRQGPDRGPQYRSIAFYKNENEKKVIEQYLELLESSNVYDRPIVTEVTKFDTFWKAEEYHQDFERKNPNNSYVRAVSIPRLNRFKENFREYLKEEAH